MYVANVISVRTLTNRKKDSHDRFFNAAKREFSIGSRLRDWAEINSLPAFRCSIASLSVALRHIVPRVLKSVMTLLHLCYTFAFDVGTLDTVLRDTPVTRMPEKHTASAITLASRTPTTISIFKLRYRSPRLCNIVSPNHVLNRGGVTKWTLNWSRREPKKSVLWV